MKNKTIAIKNNKTGFLVELILYLIENTNYFGTTVGFLIAQLNKEQALALLQKASSWNTFPIFELLSQKILGDKEIILSALNKTTRIAHAISIISRIHNILKINPNLVNDVAHSIINKYGINYRHNVMKILQTSLFFTEEEATSMMKNKKPE